MNKQYCDEDIDLLIERLANTISFDDVYNGRASVLSTRNLIRVIGLDLDSGLPLSEDQKKFLVQMLFNIGQGMDANEACWLTQKGRRKKVKSKEMRIALSMWFSIKFKSNSIASASRIVSARFHIEASTIRDTYRRYVEKIDLEYKKILAEKSTAIDS